MKTYTSIPAKVVLPDVLRQRLQDWQKNLPLKISEHSARLEDAEKKLRDLRDEEARLSQEVATLQQGTRYDDAAAIEKLVRLEAQLRILQNQLQNADNFAEELKASPVALGASDLLQELFLFYRGVLTDLIARHVQPFYRDEHGARHCAQHSHAVQSLFGVRDLATSQRGATARPEMVQFVNDIFERALRGEPAIYFAAPVSETAAAS